MDLSALQEYVEPGLLVLIPVLYIIGMAVRNAAWIDNKHIPLVLGLLGIILAVVYLFATASYTTPQDIAMMVFTAIVQGVLCAGTAVYVNQLFKQNSTAG